VLQRLELALTRVPSPWRHSIPRALSLANGNAKEMEGAIRFHDMRAVNRRRPRPAAARIRQSYWPPSKFLLQPGDDLPRTSP